MRLPVSPHPQTALRPGCEHLYEELGPVKEEVGGICRAGRRLGRASDQLFAVLLALALLLRLWLAVRGHAIRHPDEVFQGLEQAHRMVFGYGVPTIEMARHLRWPGLAAMLAVPQYFAALL